ncbi:hypothetical protein CRM22_000486 [Opisthorchis felineus]|uniref:Uncharacterized protein n=1 Tax=Opisthorchis felineus TaxID=147828 RepID=A0A4S2MET1_OPIFE|nr:hypothetical protein CRM22_000486 [Opisthorchis felineus]
MASLIKSQIIKPFLQFTKNLSADQINLSIVKGEAQLDSLELNEAVLMELLGLPTWLNLRKAQCSGISFKIRWTKLNTHPVCVVIDQIDVELEALENPRPEVDSLIASYRIGSGKYRLADRVVDGATVLINAVSIRFCAKAFEASIEISRLSLVSKTPTWQTGPLKLTSLLFPNADAVLIFKELSWDSARIVADGLLNELNGTPVKLITNSGRIRVTLKKRLSDSALISSRMQLYLDDLLWILTLSQVEAAVVFARSLQHSVFLAAEQSRQFAASRAKRQHLSWSNVPQPTETASTRQKKAGKKDLYSAAALLFHRYDVVETSYHLTLYRTEMHFCDEAKNDTNLTATPNGYIKVHFNKLELDWYPYHLNTTPRVSWHGSREFHEARNAWLRSLNPVHTVQLSLRESTSVNSDNPTADVLSEHDLVNSDPSIFQSVIVFRICDLDVSLLSLPEVSVDVSSGDRHGTMGQQHHHLGEEIPANASLFIGSDKKLHCLPESVYFLTVELNNIYRSYPSKQHPPGMEADTLPCFFFAQLKPFYVRFDADTVIWLNMFLLTLHLNLYTLMRQTSLLSQDTGLIEPKSYHLRCEALMPRLLLPLCSAKPDNSVGLPGPDMLVLQADQLFIQLLVPPVTTYTASVLRGLLAEQPSSSSFQNITDPGGGPCHIPLDVNKFAYLICSARSNQVHPSRPDSPQFWCLHCPHVWAEFLTVVEIFDASSSEHCPRSRTRCTVYRQSFLESIPLSLWVVQCAPQSSRPPLNVLVDIDCSLNPLESSNPRIPMDTPPINPDDCILISLGMVPPTGLGHHWIPVSYSRLPDTLDQLLLLSQLLNQLMEVKDQVNVDIIRIYLTELSSSHVGPTSISWLFTLSFRLRRPIQVQITGLESNSSTDESPSHCDFHLSNLHRPVDMRDTSLASASDRSPEEGQKATTTVSPRVSVQQFPHLNPHSSCPAAMSNRCEDMQFSDPAKKDRQSPRLGLKNERTHLSSSLSSGSDSGLFKLTKDSETGSIAGSQESWLNTYEILLASDDANSVNLDSLSIMSQDERSTAGNHFSTTTSAEEIGLELSEDDPSVYTCSYLRRGEAMFRQKTPTKTPFREPGRSQSIVTPPCVAILLKGLCGIADACQTELRLWVNLQSFEAFSVDPADGKKKYAPTTGSRLDAADNSVAEQTLLSVFLSATKDTSRSSYQNPSWDSCLSLSADLLQTWSLQITPTIRCLLIELATEFARRSNWHSHLLKTPKVNTTLLSAQLPQPSVDVHIKLKGGSVEFDMQPEGVNGDENQFFRKIRVQQGLSIHLDRDAIFRIGFDPQNPPYAATRRTFSPVGHADSLEKLSPEIPSSHQILLNQYSNENKRLKDQVESLTSQVAELEFKLNQMRHINYANRQPPRSES